MSDLDRFIQFVKKQNSDVMKVRQLAVPMFIKMTAAEAEKLQVFPNLETLIITDNKQLKSLSFLKHLKYLVNLNVSRCDIPFEELRHLANCPHLKQFYLGADDDERLKVLEEVSKYYSLTYFDYELDEEEIELIQKQTKNNTEVQRLQMILQLYSQSQQKIEEDKVIEEIVDSKQTKTLDGMLKGIMAIWNQLDQNHKALCLGKMIGSDFPK